MRAACVLALWIAFAGAPAYAQQACTEDDAVDQQEVYRIVGLESADPPEDKALAAADEAADSPRLSPDATQLSALAASGASPDILNLADFSSLLALAVDNGLLSDSGGALTLDLNFFSAIVAFDASVIEEQEKYEQKLHKELRKLGGSISWGGKGESFDRDGDGEVDEALTAESSSDIVTWDVHYRLVGSRDRRDPENYNRILDAMTAADEGGKEAFTKLAFAIGNLSRPEAGSGKRCRAAAEELARQPETEALVAQIRGFDEQAAQIREEVVKDIDKDLLITLSFGGTERQEIFGPDKLAAGIRASWGGADAGLTANLDFTRTEGLGDEEDREAFKLAVSYSRILMQGGMGHEQQGVTLAFSLAAEKYRNVPEAAHDRIARANVKLTYPISEAVSLPISLTWANHEDLLQDEEEVRGHIGFTFDVRKLFATSSQ